MATMSTMSTKRSNRHSGVNQNVNQCQPTAERSQFTLLILNIL